MCYIFTMTSITFHNLKTVYWNQYLGSNITNEFSPKAKSCFKVTFIRELAKYNVSNFISKKKDTIFLYNNIIKSNLI